MLDVVNPLEKRAECFYQIISASSCAYPSSRATQAALRARRKRRRKNNAAITQHFNDEAATLRNLVMLISLRILDEICANSCRHLPSVVSFEYVHIAMRCDGTRLSHYAWILNEAPSSSAPKNMQEKKLFIWFRRRLCGPLVRKRWTNFSARNFPLLTTIPKSLDITRNRGTKSRRMAFHSFISNSNRCPGRAWRKYGGLL